MRSPMQSALIAALVTFLVGVGLSLLMVKMGKMEKVSWTAAVVVPVVIAAVVYFSSKS